MLLSELRFRQIGVSMTNEPKFSTSLSSQDDLAKKVPGLAKCPILAKPRLPAGLLKDLIRGPVCEQNLIQLLNEVTLFAPDDRKG